MIKVYIANAADKVMGLDLGGRLRKAANVEGTCEVEETLAGFGQGGASGFQGKGALTCAGF